MRNYEFYCKYTDSIFIYRNTITNYFNLAKVGEDKFLLEHDVYFIHGPFNGFGIINDEHREYYIDLNAENVFPWLSLANAFPFTIYKAALIQEQDISAKYNFIDTTGKFLFEDSFDDVLSCISNTYCLVRNNTQFIFDLKQGKLFQEVWKL